MSRYHATLERKKIKAPKTKNALFFIFFLANLASNRPLTIDWFIFFLMFFFRTYLDEGAYLVWQAHPLTWLFVEQRMPCGLSNHQFKDIDQKNDSASFSLPPPFYHLPTVTKKFLDTTITSVKVAQMILFSRNGVHISIKFASCDPLPQV